MYNMEKLKHLRKAMGFTIYDMARFLKITPSFYCQIENGRRRLFYDTAFQICHVLQVKPDAIFFTK